MDRFIVRDELTKDLVWWGDDNLSFDQKFDKLHKKILNYLAIKKYMLEMHMHVPMKDID